MDFFKSVFSDNPDQITQTSESESPTKPPQKDYDDEDPDPNHPSEKPHSSSNPNSSAIAGGGDGGWSFGGLFKTISTKSESVLETYRRDLKEFGTGLKKESAAFREAASRAVKDLPASIEVAQGSLETVWKSTTEIISHGKDSILAAGPEFDSSDKQSANSKHYSIFDARLRAIQSDLSTYCEEPEDLEDYNKWKLGFVLEEKGEEVEKLIEENGAMESVYKRVVPNEVDHETFWIRYFYKLHKLKQAEYVRASLVKRAISKEDEEDLSWDFDDEEDEEEGTNALPKSGLSKNKEPDDEDSKQAVVEREMLLEKRGLNGRDSNQAVVENEDSLEKRASRNEDSLQVAEKEKEDSAKVREPSPVTEETNVEESRAGGVGSIGVVDEKGENVSSEVVTESRQEKMQADGTTGMKDDGSVLKSIEQKCSEGGADPSESSKDSDFSIVSSQQSVPEEEDLGWDEFEDLGGIDEKRATRGGSPNRADLRKRLSTAAEEEEDLGWDTEDDDEPIKT